MKQMSNRFKMIICIGMLGISGSCATASREDVSVIAESPMERQSSPALLEKQLKNEKLSPQVLNAFELKAVTKLEECYEYFQLISNPEYDTTFRKEAIKQTLSLFSEESVPLTTGMNTTTAPVSMFLQELFEGKWGETTYQVSQIAWKSPLESTEDTIYIGQVTYRLMLNGQYVSEMPIVQDVIVKKVYTSFGAEVKKVWKVFLGDSKQ